VTGGPCGHCRRLERQRDKLSEKLARSERLLHLAVRLKVLAWALFGQAEGGQQGQRRELLEVLGQMDRHDLKVMARGGVALLLLAGDWCESGENDWQRVHLSESDGQEARWVGRRWLSEESLQVFELRGRYYAQGSAHGDGR
jgi:hypothetical protein